MNAIKNITIGHTERLYKSVGYTMLANLVNIVPFCLSIEAVRIIFSAFDGSRAATYHRSSMVYIRRYGCLYAVHGFADGHLTVPISEKLMK